MLQGVGFQILSSERLLSPGWGTKCGQAQTQRKNPRAATQESFLS